MNKIFKQNKIRQTHRFQNHFGRMGGDIWKDYTFKITKRCDSIHAKPVRALDLRGSEQVCTRMEAEQYAGLLGYRLFHYGEGSSPIEVGHDIFQLDYKNNRYLTHGQLIKLEAEGMKALFA